MRTAWLFLLIASGAGCFVDALGGGAGGADDGSTETTTSGSPTTTSGAGAGPSTTTSTSSSSSAGGSGQGGSGEGGSGEGGQGGSPPDLCGNGFIDAGEQCDPGLVPSDYCSGCMVVCNGMYEVLNPANNHCYYNPGEDGMHYSWIASRGWCTVQWGGDQVVIDDAAELAFVQGLPAGVNEHRWLGASDLVVEDVFVWIDVLVPWTYQGGMPPWFGSEPNGGGNDDCVIIRPDGLFEEVDCNQANTHHFCERAPVGL